MGIEQRKATRVSLGVRFLFLALSIVAANVKNFFHIYIELF
jgi:hypothetical protein